jgi:hypothetical protein
VKVGDLVRCIWQPRTAGYIQDVGCIDMKHIIKGQIGIVRAIHDPVRHRYLVMFPGCGGYTHSLAFTALERLG